MNILLINGSPKGKRSNSLKLANSFIEGLKQKKEENGEQVTVCEMDVAALKSDRPAAANESALYEQP